MNITGVAAFPFTVSAIFPVVAPVGTGTAMELALQYEGTPLMPLNVTELFTPCDEPKFDPLIVIS